MAESTQETSNPTPVGQPAAEPAPTERPAPPARLPSALVTGDVFLHHRVPDFIPDQPERLRLSRALIEAGMAEGSIPADKVLRLDPRPATEAELAAVHTPAYIARVHAVAEQ